MIKKNGGIFGRNPTYNDVVVEGVLTLKEAQVFDNDITINGDLTVNGTETVINTVELNVDDKNITMGAVVAKVGLTSTSNITLGQFTVLIADTAGLVPGMTVTKTAGTGAFAAGAKIASVDSHYQITLDLAHTATGSITFDTGGATDFTADGGGITLKGLTDKFIKWVKSTAAWTFSDKIEAPDVTVTNLTASLPVFTDANKKLITQSQQNALNAIAGAVTAARFLRGDGTNVTLSAIQAADVPTLNQSTTGSALSVKSNATTGLLQVAGPTAGTTRVMTTPDANFTAARTDAAQSFTGLQTFNNGVVANYVNGIKIDNAGTMLGQLYYSGGLVLNRASGTALLIQQNGSGEMTFTTDGNIQVGSATSATAKLFLYANNSAGDAAGNAAMYIRQDGTNHIQTWAGAGGNVRGYWESAGDLVIDDTNIRFATSGKGIDFSATGQASGMTSELLDDYEEGTWTPTPSGITVNSGTPVYSGSYTKVGRLVTVNWYMSGGNITTVAGTSKFTNLPFSNVEGYSHGIFINELTYASGPMESGPTTNLQLFAAITGSYMGGTITYMAAT